MFICIHLAKYMCHLKHMCVWCVHTSWYANTMWPLMHAQVRLWWMHNLCSLTNPPCCTASTIHSCPVSLVFQCHAYLQASRRFSCSTGQSGPLENCIWPAESHECSLVWAACHQRSRSRTTCRHRQAVHYQLCCLELHLLTAVLVLTDTVLTQLA